MLNRDQMLRIAGDTLTWAETRPDIRLAVTIYSGEAGMAISLVVGDEIRNLPLNRDVPTGKIFEVLDIAAAPTVASEADGSMTVRYEGFPPLPGTRAEKKARVN